MSAPHEMEVSEVAAAFRARTLSPVEYLRGLLARIDAREPALNVFIAIDREGALASARRAEAEILAGRSLGPLHGLAVGVKDCIDADGFATTCHSKILAGTPHKPDATVIRKLREAGAIILGKVALHEFAIGGPSFDLPFPPARNPWNRDHHPGGSSSGSGAGVAAGFFPLALGTDTGGSVRHPASACGLVGMKPTYGLVSRRGVFPLSYTLDHVGPITRGVSDNAFMLAAIAGHDPADPGSARGVPTAFDGTLGEGVRGLRIGYVRHFHETDTPADPQVAAALDDVARLLASEGAVVKTIVLPPLQEFEAANAITLYSEAWSIHAPWLRQRPQDYCRIARRRLLAGPFLGAGHYVDAQRRRRQLIGAVEEAFGDVDILLCASSMQVACRIDDEAEVSRTYAQQARIPFNLTGHPALAMMSGLSREGLPMSVQFAAPYWGEATLYRVAAAFERAMGWDKSRPRPA